MTALTKVDARTLTDSIRANIENAWTGLIEAYESGAHTALGYGSWGVYMQIEFGQSKSRAYRLLDKERVQSLLESHSHSGNGELPNQKQATELAPLKDRPELVQKAWDRATEEAISEGRSVTAGDVKKAREQLEGGAAYVEPEWKSPDWEPDLSREPEESDFDYHFRGALTSIEICAEDLEQLHRDIDQVDQEERPKLFYRVEAAVALLENAKARLAGEVIA